MKKSSRINTNSLSVTAHQVRLENIPTRPQPTIGRNFLLVMSCSATKRGIPGLLPAIERYDGGSYWVLAKARREGYLPASPGLGIGVRSDESDGNSRLDILILSAKYGWLLPTDLIENYDQVVTRARALELQPTVGPALDQLLEQPPSSPSPCSVLSASPAPYHQVYLNLGQTYRLALDTSTQLPLLLKQPGKVVLAQGGIGQRAAQLKTWLHQIKADQTSSVSSQ